MSDLLTVQELYGWVQAYLHDIPAHNLAITEEKPSFFHPIAT